MEPVHYIMEHNNNYQNFIFIENTVRFSTNELCFSTFSFVVSNNEINRKCCIHNTV